jgi:hypothetical protein
MKQNIYRIILISYIFLTLIGLILTSCTNQKNKNDVLIQKNENDIGSNQDRQKEIYGQNDNLHYLSNYFEQNIDTILIQYRYNLCLCPKWYIEDTNEPIWLEALHNNEFTNNSNREIDGKKIKVIGRFYKYKAVPLNLYDYKYLSEKSIPNARIFKIQMKLRK